MFKSLKKKGEKVKEKIDFKFAFHATKVPNQGWDKLVVSVVPLETGRVSYKTTRASVKNGNCQWPDAVIESVKLLQDTKSKEYDEKLYKFIVSTGSSRSGILGEITIDISEYTATNNSSQIAIPLKNCNSGTILHTSITCLTPRTNSSRDLGRNRTSERSEIALEDDEVLSGTDDEDLEDSDLSGNLTTGSITSTTSAPPLQHQSSSQTKALVGSTAATPRLQRDGPVMRSNSDTQDLATAKSGGINGNGRFSSGDLLSAATNKERDRERDQGVAKTISSQDSNNSVSSHPPPAYIRGHVPPSSNGVAAGKGSWHDSYVKPSDRAGRTPQGTGGSHAGSQNGSRVSSQTDLGGKEALQAGLIAAETTIEELRAETITTQRQNRKFSNEIETLKQQLNAHMRHEAENGIEMTTLVAERDRLKQELEQMKSSRMALEEKENGDGNTRWKVEDAQRAIRELQEEIRYQKETNLNLNLQLRKTQDSNMELVLAIRDVEESLEQQRKEAEEVSMLNDDLKANLSTKLQEFIEAEKTWAQKLSSLEEASRGMGDRGLKDSSKTDDANVLRLENMVQILTKDVEDLERDLKELTDENIELYEKSDKTNKELEAKSKVIAELEENIKMVSSSSLAPQPVPEDHSDLSRLKGIIRDLEGQLQSSEDNHRGQLTRSKSLVEDMEALLKELRAANDHLDQRLKAAENESQLARLELDGTHVKVASLVMEKEKFLKERLESEQSLAEVREALSVKEMELKTMEESASQTYKDHSIAMEGLASLKDEIVNIEAARDRAENLVVQLQHDKTELTRQLESIECEQERTFQGLQECKSEIVMLLQQISTHVAKERDLEFEVAELEKYKIEADGRWQDSREEDRLKNSRIEELEFQLSILTDEIDSINSSQREIEGNAVRLETENNGLCARKKELEIGIQAAEEEAKTSRLHARELEEELSTLKVQMELQSTMKQNLELRSSELESAKDELENQLTDLEEENLQQGGEISSLKEQLRFVMDERESHRVAKGHVEARAQDFQMEKSKLEAALQAAAKEHQQKVFQLEEHASVIAVEKEHHLRSVHELERKVETLSQEVASHIESLRLANVHIVDIERMQIQAENKFKHVYENYTAATVAIASLEADAVHLQTEHFEKNKVLATELETLMQLKEEASQRASRAEESLQRTRMEKAIAVERLQAEVHRLTEQMSSTVDEKEKMASQALVEASDLRAEKAEWEEKIRQVEEKLMQADADSFSLRAEFNFRVQELATELEASQKKEQDTAFKLQDSLHELANLKVNEASSRMHANTVDQALVAMQQEKESLMQEAEELRETAQEAEMLKAELNELEFALEQVRCDRNDLETFLEKTKAQSNSIQEEKVMLEKKISTLLLEAEELKRSKKVLEEQIQRLQSDREAQGTVRTLDVEQRGETIRLKRQNSEFKRKLSEHEEEKEEFRRRVQMLEGELQEKVNALGMVEKKLKERDSDENGKATSNGGSPGFLSRSLTRSNSKVGPMSSSPSKELTDLREKIKVLESDLKSKEMALESLRRDFTAKESLLYNKIELLEMANEQLAQGDIDLGMDQLQMELLRLQNLNSVQARRERELMSQLSTHEVLHKEVQRLQEENEQLENRLLRFKESSKGGDLLDRLVTLETELAEAMEANAMYKLQLRNAFAKQQNVHAAALQNFGDVDQVISDLVGLKRHTTKLEDDLKDLRERYTNMSLRFAEVEAQREELVMTVRNLKNCRRP